MKTNKTQIHIVTQLVKAIKDGDSKNAAQISAIEKKVDRLSSNEMESVSKIANGLFKNIKGETGEQGEQGIPGIQGERGEIGPEGPMGQTGPVGMDGRDGLDGRDGRDGTDGKDGKNGKDGRDGKDAIIDEEIVKNKLDPIVKDIYTKVGRAIDGMPRGSNYGGFIETQLKDSTTGKILSKDGSGAWLVSASGGSTGAVINATDSGDHTNFTLAEAATTSQYYIIMNNGMYTTDDSTYPFSVSGTTLTFTSALPTDLASSIIKLICV